MKKWVIFLPHQRTKIETEVIRTPHLLKHSRTEESRAEWSGT